MMKYLVNLKLIKILAILISINILASGDIEIDKSIKPVSFRGSCLEVIKNFNTGYQKRVSSKRLASLYKFLDDNQLSYKEAFHWEERDRDFVKRYLIDRLGFKFLIDQKMGKVAQNYVAGPARVDINEIRFLQVTVNNRSGDGKYTVLNNARDFKNGDLKPEDLPPIRVYRDIEGRIWTLDHRRLAALKLSGAFSEVPVVFVEKEVVKESRFKYGSKDMGKSLFIKIGNGTVVVLYNDTLK